MVRKIVKKKRKRSPLRQVATLGAPFPPALTQDFSPKRRLIFVALAGLLISILLVKSGEQDQKPSPLLQKDASPKNSPRPQTPSAATPAAQSQSTTVAPAAAKYQANADPAVAPGSQPGMAPSTVSPSQIEPAASTPSVAPIGQVITATTAAPEAEFKAAPPVASESQATPAAPAAPQGQDEAATPVAQPSQGSIEASASIEVKKSSVQDSTQVAALPAENYPATNAEIAPLPLSQRGRVAAAPALLAPPSAEQLAGARLAGKARLGDIQEDLHTIVEGDEKVFQEYFILDNENRFERVELAAGVAKDTLVADPSAGKPAMVSLQCKAKDVARLRVYDRNFNVIYEKMFTAEADGELKIGWNGELDQGRAEPGRYVIRAVSGSDEVIKEIFLKK